MTHETSQLVIEVVSEYDDDGQTALVSQLVIEVASLDPMPVTQLYVVQ